MYQKVNHQCYNFLTFNVIKNLTTNVITLPPTNSKRTADWLLRIIRIYKYYYINFKNHTTSCFDVRHCCFNATKSLNIVTFRLGVKTPAQELTFCSILCCKRKVQRCLSANRLSFSELFDDISLVLNVRRLCVVVDSLISAAKVCDCVISAWC